MAQDRKKYSNHAESDQNSGIVQGASAANHSDNDNKNFQKFNSGNVKIFGKKIYQNYDQIIESQKKQ